MRRSPETKPARRARLLPGDRSGATALEFALIGPAFVLLLLLVIESAWQLTIDLALDVGVMVGSRYAITGAGYGAGSTYNTVVSMIVSASGGILKQANLTLTPKAYVNPASFASGGGSTATTGSSGQVVAYTATYTQPFLTGLPGTVLGYGSLTHTATVIVQNEPF